ncbi:protein NRT1/ PTR FAMILY 5.10-like isoform X1 [Ipomoea triloba]|uniref:protein NRT1/ PTR FAMILY 5.10-like isoform X1 n=1 Tax=Ipomoea triloba TaxID=35885 RepID=UPI00125D923A|nr:protein NRT1/ PTR FAMILY 5.10-like isoform X1 [Ipomoea triloba]
MASGATMELPDAETQFLQHDFVDGSVDYKGRPAIRSRSGRWRSAYFIIGVEMAERFAYYGIGLNLISYLTGPLGQSTATAAENVNAWTGTASLLPLLGAFVADSFLGRYRTIISASVLYILGLGFLTLSAVLHSKSSNCQDATDKDTCSPPQFEIIFFFFSLYLVGLAQGGHKPCVQAFGADQFDTQDPQENKAKSSFFNWWYFGMNFGIFVALLVLTYIQDYLSWGLGFGIPCVVMGIALIVFLFGTITYRFQKDNDNKNPFVRIGRVFIYAAKNHKTSTTEISMELEVQGILPNKGSQQFMFLNKALLAPNGSKEDRKTCTIDEVNEAKAILRLVPIWVTCLGYALVFAQTSTLFTKQGATMDRSIGSIVEVPAASLQCIICFSILVVMPIYDRVLVPIARAITRRPSGITMLQRIGTGLVFSILGMVIAAVVEKKRLQTALDYGLVDTPEVTLPINVCWLIPQYILVGISEAFSMVGLQEFFYDQMPSELKSVGLSLYLSIFGIGSFLSSFLISIIDHATGGDGQDSWFSDNLNRAHLDYFYWLVAGLSTLAFVAYLYFSRLYIYNKATVA